MALGSTQPLTEMSTRSISWGKGGRCVRLTTLQPSCAVVTKSGNLNFLEPSGPLRAFNGTDLPFYVCVYTYTHIHISDTVQTACELPLLPNNTAVKQFYTNCCGAKCRLDICGRGAGLTATGRIRGIGQNVFQSGFETVNSSSHSYCHILLLFAFLEETFIR